MSNPNAGPSGQPALQSFTSTAQAGGVTPYTAVVPEGVPEFSSRNQLRDYLALQNSMAMQAMLSGAPSEATMIQAHADKVRKTYATAVADIESIAADPIFAKTGEHEEFAQATKLGYMAKLNQAYSAGLIPQTSASLAEVFSLDAQSTDGQDKVIDLVKAMTPVQLDQMNNLQDRWLNKQRIKLGMAAGKNGLTRIGMQLGELDAEYAGSGSGESRLLSGDLYGSQYKTIQKLRGQLRDKGLLEDGLLESEDSGVTINRDGKPTTLTVGELYHEVKDKDPDTIRAIRDQFLGLSEADRRKAMKANPLFKSGGPLATEAQEWDSSSKKSEGTVFAYAPALQASDVNIESARALTRVFESDPHVARTANMQISVMKRAIDGTGERDTSAIQDVFSHLGSPEQTPAAAANLYVPLRAEALDYAKRIANMDLSSSERLKLAMTYRGTIDALVHYMGTASKIGGIQGSQLEADVLKIQALLPKRLRGSVVDISDPAKGRRWQGTITPLQGSGNSASSIPNANDNLGVGGLKPQ